MLDKKVMVLGASGRVGLQLSAELLRHGVQVAAVDIVDESLLQQKLFRTLNDARLATGAACGQLSLHARVDALSRDQVAAILAAEQPDLVINYAIPFTWDATKALPNYQRISAAGLGAFTPLQVLTPVAVARAMVEAGSQAHYMVGNLPDITVPVIAGIAASGTVRKPSAGAGNVGLIQVAMHNEVAMELDVPFEAVDVSLVAHHIHWVAPREPGYRNDAPFLARIAVHGEDVSESLGDLRALMNRAINANYESDAAFSSTTGVLAARVAMALLDDSGREHRLHAPAPNGLPGGYPLRISNGDIEVDLPDQWSLDRAVEAMQQAHRGDGVERIDADGTVHFTQVAQDVLQAELGFDLPATMAPADIEAVAQAQMDVLRQKLA